MKLFYLVGSLPWVGAAVEGSMEKDVETMSTLTDYMIYRGKCRELAEAVCSEDTSFRLVRGYYHCPMWGKQAHWWAQKPDGTIVDPSVKQFPTAGAFATYEEYDGKIECEHCHKSVPEQDAYMVERHAYCSYECYGHDIGF